MNALQLVFDVGLLVLIWMVQLVVYPSFTHYQKQNLYQWHKKYTFRIGCIVMPLMIGQLSIAVFTVLSAFSLLNLFILSLIVGVWLSTFMQFVPLHHKISSNRITNEVLDRLVKLNWVRTFLWTVIFLLGFI